MYKVSGTIINAFHSPATEKYEASYKVQLLGDNPLIDGQVKKEMLTLNVPLSIFDKLKPAIGQIVTLPIGFYIKNGLLVTFFPKHSVAEKSGLPA